MDNKSDAPKQPFYGRAFQRLINAAAYIVLRPDVEWEDVSAKTYLKNNPAIFVCNHTHHFDGTFAGAVFDRYRPYTLVMRKWYDRKYVGRLIRLCRGICIDLNAADAQWYQTCIKILENGGSVIIFPEGAIARDGEMLDFKSGAAMLSAVTGAAIVPAAIYGKYNILHGHRQRILIGSPIKPECPENMRRSRYAARLIKDTEYEVHRLYNVLQMKYGNIGTYWRETDTVPDYINQKMQEVNLV